MAPVARPAAYKGLRLLEEREIALEELRAKGAARRGELLDGHVAFEEIRQLSARRRSAGK